MYTAFKTEQHTLILRTIPTTHFKQNAQISFGKVKSDSDIVIENEQDVQVAELVSAEMDANDFNLLGEWEEFKERLLVKKNRNMIIDQQSLPNCIYFNETVDVCTVKSKNRF